MYIIDKYSNNYNKEEKDIVLNNFLQSYEHEKNFFDMAYRQEKWLFNK